MAVLWLRARMVPCMGGLCWSHPVPSWDQWLMLLLGHKPWRGGGGVRVPLLRHK